MAWEVRRRKNLHKEGRYIFFYLLKKKAVFAVDPHIRIIKTCFVIWSLLLLLHHKVENFLMRSSTLFALLWTHSTLSSIYSCYELYFVCYFVNMHFLLNFLSVIIHELIFWILRSKFNFGRVDFRASTQFKTLC